MLHHQLALVCKLLPGHSEKFTPGLQILDFFYHFLLVETSKMQKVN